MEDERQLDDPLNVEGLAAQLYVQSARGAHFAWWHLLREPIKKNFREQARKQISDFLAKSVF